MGEPFRRRPRARPRSTVRASQSGVHRGRTPAVGDEPFGIPSPAFGRASLTDDTHASYRRTPPPGRTPAHSCRGRFRWERRFRNGPPSITASRTASRRLLIVVGAHLLPPLASSYPSPEPWGRCHRALLPAVPESPGTHPKNGKGPAKRLDGPLKNFGTTSLTDVVPKFCLLSSFSMMQDQPHHRLCV